MDPAKAQLAYDLMMKGVNEATVKIDAADVQKAKEFMLKQFDENARNNNYWLDVLYNYNRWGVDSYTNYKDIVKSLTPEKLSAFLKNVILSSGNKMEVMMTPAQ
jgi:zinc protease